MTALIRNDLRDLPGSSTVVRVPSQLDKKLQRILLDTVMKLGNQARVAEQLGVDQANVSRWLAGRQGMDVGQCLRLAKLTQHRAADIMLWANHNPCDYLESGNLPPLSTEAQDVANRVRLLEWERKRSEVPQHVRPMLDKAVDSVITSWLQACESEGKHRSEEDRQRSRRKS